MVLLVNWKQNFTLTVYTFRHMIMIIRDGREINLSVSVGTRVVFQGAACPGIRGVGVLARRTPPLKISRSSSIIKLFPSQHSTSNIILYLPYDNNVMGVIVSACYY